MSSTGPSTSSSASASTSFATVKVAAPSDLLAGEVFTAKYGNHKFLVTVPEGGVRAGEIFEAPTPPSLTKDGKEKEESMSLNMVAVAVDYSKSISTTTSSSTTTTASEAVQEAHVMMMIGDDDTERLMAVGMKPVELEGRWRFGLFHCFPTCCFPFWMAICCQGILLGQLLQRFKLTPIGTPAQGLSYENTCSIVMGLALLGMFGGFLFGNGPIANSLGGFLFLYILIVLTKIRYDYRKRHTIPADCCGVGGNGAIGQAAVGSCFSDCLLSYCCSCCVLLQLHRQTHDESEYPYRLCSNTGLMRNGRDVYTKGSHRAEIV